MSLLKKQPPNALLGISFADRRVTAGQLRRSGSSITVEQTATTELSGNLLTLDAAVAGKEIREWLRQSGIRENRCVVALPLQIVLSFQADLPALDAADRAAFIATEAERNFPFDPEALFVGSSICQLEGGRQLATIAAVQLQQLEKLQATFQAAQLKVLSFTPAITALAKPRAAAAAAISLYLAGTSAELAVTAGGGVATLRSLEGAFEQNASEPRLHSDVVGRELRVTLGQLPEALRNTTSVLRLFGEKEASARLLTDLGPRLSALGLKTEVLSSDAAESNPGSAAATQYLLQQKPVFEFLPPKTSAWRQFTSKTSSRKLAWAGGALAAAAVIVFGAFFIQNWKLSELQTKWSAMEPRVKDLDDMQQQIRRFRPWFDNSFRTLSIMRILTEAFPVDGVVSAKTVEIRNLSQVTCSGVARDNQALFKMLDQLRGAKSVTDVKMDQIRGKSPLQFSFNFKWAEGGGSER